MTNGDQEIANKNRRLAGLPTEYLPYSTSTVTSGLLLLVAPLGTE